METLKRFFVMLIALVAAVTLGANGSVLMADGVVATDGANNGNDASTDNTQQPTNGGGDGGTASVTQGQQITPEEYVTDLEKDILVIDPTATAFLSLTSDVASKDIESQEFEFYSIGPRIIRAKTTAAPTLGQDRFTLPVDDPGFCTKDDTIRVVGIKGKRGNQATQEDLMLIVLGKDDQLGTPTCMAVNYDNFIVAAGTIPVGTTLIRMGKSCSETAAQTGRAYQAPGSQKGNVQNFMLQIEQTKFDQMTKKRVSWDFDDLVEWNLRDYKIAKEATFIFGAGGISRHNAWNNENNYTMQGIWWQAGRDIEIGTLQYAADGTTPIYEADGTTQKVEITGTNLVAFTKAAFLGNAGSQTKYLFAGANVVEAFDNIKGKQYETKDIVTENDLTVQRFKTSFGTIKLVYFKLFDVCGMANAAFLLDKQYMKKNYFMHMKKNVLDLMKSGQRNVNAVVLQEVVAVYLKYADAHARVWLAGRTNLYDWTVAAKYENYNATTKIPPKKGTGQFKGAEDRLTHDRANA